LTVPSNCRAAAFQKQTFDQATRVYGKTPAIFYINDRLLPSPQLIVAESWRIVDTTQTELPWNGIMSLVADILKNYNRLEMQDSESGRQFHRLSDLVDVLDKSKPGIDELHSLFDRFDLKRKSSKSARMLAECTLVCCHIAWLGRLKDDKRLTRSHQDFVLRTDQEGLISSDEYPPERVKTATFFLPSHERSIGSLGGGVAEYRKDLFETRTKRQFFQRIQSVLAKTWPSLEREISANTLDANAVVRNEFMQFMHKQLLQNALTHAYAEAVHNPNYTKHYLDHYKDEGADFLFGSLAYLEVRTLEPGRMDKKLFGAELASYHQDLSPEANRMYDRLLSRGSRIIAFSYCDTGPGIERHIRHFSPSKSELPEEFDIKFAMDNRLAGRAVARAGEGLADIRRHSQDARAILIIETTDGSYLLSEQLSVDEVCKKSRVKRGTSVSVLFET